MPNAIKKRGKITYTHSSKTEVLKKLNESTRLVSQSAILSVLKDKGAADLPLAELRKRLSILKTPLSQEIIAERRKI